jgi:hypothetical protein
MTNLDKAPLFCDTARAETLANQQASSDKGRPMREILEHHLIETLEIPEDASHWLMGMWDAIQFLDDIADGDAVGRGSFDRALHHLLVGLPSNKFFTAHAQQLLPVVAVQLLKWQASDIVERAGAADARSYMWRAGYYDLVLWVVQLCHGYDAAVTLAPVVMSLYGETAEDYEKEFANA